MTIPPEPLADALKTIEALRSLLKAEELESSLQHVRADEANFDLGELRRQIETLQYQTETLISALTSVRSMDTGAWRRIRFDPDDHAWRQVVFKILPSGLLIGKSWTPLSEHNGDKWLLVRVEGGYELHESEGNK